MLLIQTAYQKVKGLGLPCAVVLRILAGCCVGRTSERCSVGPEARRGFCPAGRVSASGLSAGTNTISPDLRRTRTHRMLRTDRVVAALFLSGHAPDRHTRPRSFTEGRFLLGSESLRAQAYPKAARLYPQLYRISMNTTAEYPGQ